MMWPVLVFPFGMVPSSHPPQVGLQMAVLRSVGHFGFLLCIPLWFPISTPNLGHSAPCFTVLGRSAEHQGNIPGGPGEPRGSVEGTEGEGHLLELYPFLPQSVPGWVCDEPGQRRLFLILCACRTV